ncbi:MAG: YggT family protein [Candidatus Aminicenantes bacterium]|nr:YggT family protein [Candidatus Aminicenantes bacterium]
MILLGNLLYAVSRIVHIILNIYIWVIFAHVILSWIRTPSLYKVRLILYKLTEPVLAPIRRFIPPYKFGGLDISPIIAFVLILFIDTVVVKSISQYALQILGPQTYSF